MQPELRTRIAEALGAGDMTEEELLERIRLTTEAAREGERLREKLRAAKRSQKGLRKELKAAQGRLRRVLEGVPS